MPFSPEDFYELAKKLVKSADEASHRTAISRIYYSVFLQLRILFEFVLFNTDSELHKEYMKNYKKGRMHSILLKMLKEINPVKGNYFSRLQKERRKSDYDIQLEVTKRNAEYALLLAPMILSNIEKEVTKVKNPKIKRKIKEILKN